ncbi:peptidoglycan bridge formation glycyltransferase FemA/FemB family protein [Candidatus Saccharibacteria bacterium]|nr:peptidoglycan bridge formation glycyltransferase FemA/FemB family protein [Candidatus Saccharibacteria bacterium]
MTSKNSKPAPSDLHFLQSKAWEEFQQSEGYKTFRQKGQDFEFMAILKNTPLGNYLFLPYGPCLKNKAALAAATHAIKKLAAEQKCFFVRIEPTIPFTEPEMRKIGARKSHHIDPEHTWILDLPKTDEEIYQIIGKNKARAHRNRALKNITVRTSKDVADMDIFFKFYEDVAKKDNFQTSERNYLAHQLKFDFATLYIAEFEKQAIAATIMYSGKDACYYAYAGADYEHRKKEGGAILLTQMLFDARAAGKKYFDFWGITTSDDPADPWFGFTKFKKSFGGRQIDYAGTYDIVLSPAKYRAYGVLRKINRAKRKLTRR